jgi:hypothetical protein
VFGGEPGALRLLGASLGGQAGWLLGFALVAALSSGADVAAPGASRDARAMCPVTWLAERGAAAAPAGGALSG